MASKTPETKAAKPAAKAPVKRTPAKSTKAASVPVKAKPVPTPAPIVAETPAVEQPTAPVLATAPVETPAVETPIVEKIAETVTETVAAAAQEAPATIEKEVIEMNDTIKNAADKGQAYFAEFSTKAKAAAEKSAKAFEEMNEFGKGNVEALVESGKIAAKGFETLGQDYADYARKQFEGTTAALKSFAAVKSPTEFFKLQADFVRGQFDSFVAESSKNTEAMLKLAGDVAKPISNRVAIAAEKIKVAA
ncbi:phasin family protein [Sphingomonas asaccharolytica]|uniref:phasin family protein n=1 Tax=Sphingomonas asaccharolytica TaxID=40681 RepID=UPI000837395A|nr:TIGR01841 family phasin [Sphingomonas asaccharolytica]